MRYFIAVTIALFIFQAHAQKFQLAKGTVFIDENRNGIIDEGEKGLEGAMVSNQEMVVLTDNNGYYELPVDSQTTIFVTKPAGYQTPLNENNQPRFYYHHQPAGSPNMEFPGIEKTESLPSRINFSLYQTTPKDTFQLLALADVQVADKNELDYFRRDAVQPLFSKNFDAVISLGDLVHDDLSLFPEYAESMALLGKPVYNVLGNHDVNYDVDETFSGDTFKRHFGPNYYSFDYGKVHFVVLDNVYRTCKKGEVDSPWDCYKGFIDERQLTWLKNDLKHVPEDKLVVISQHIAIEKGTENSPRNHVTNYNQLFDVLKEREKVLLLAGHQHKLRHDFFENNDGWKGKTELRQIICGSVSGSWWTGPEDERGIPAATQIDGVPNGYFIFEFEGNNFQHKFYPAGENDQQLRIESPVGKLTGQENEIIVNVFNGNRNSAVLAHIDGKQTLRLKNESGKDPFIVASFNKHSNSYKSWVTPAESSQLWKAKLPTDLAPGWHKIKITASDEYGNEYESYSVFNLIK